MMKFEVGQIYNVSKWTDILNPIYGTCEIISIEEKKEYEIEWQSTCMKNELAADCGTITYILKTATSNIKPKTATLQGVKKIGKGAHGTDIEYHWFSPTKRNYCPIKVGENRA